MPLLSALAALLLSSLPVSTSTGVLSPRRRISVRSSRPVIFGMWRSSRIKSTWPRSIAARPSAPSAAVSTAQAGSCWNRPSASRSTRTIDSSSSTISTRLVARAAAACVAISVASDEVSPLPLGVVEGVVGALDQVADVAGIVGIAGDAEARGQRAVLERIALDDRAHPLGIDQRRRLRRARQEGDELVAAVPRHDRVAPRLARQQLDDLLEHVVAGAVAPAIVDGLEAVEVEQDQ